MGKVVVSTVDIVSGHKEKTNVLTYIFRLVLIMQAVQHCTLKCLIRSHTTT